MRFTDAPSLVNQPRNCPSDDLGNVLPSVPAFNFSEAKLVSLEFPVIETIMTCDREIRVARIGGARIKDEGRLPWEGTKLFTNGLRCDLCTPENSCPKSKPLQNIGDTWATMFEKTTEAGRSTKRKAYG